MDVSFKTSKLAKVFNSDQKLRAQYGARNAGLIRECLDDLAAVECLADVRKLPHHRLHQLTANLRGKFSLDVEQPYRMLIVPDHDLVPRLPDGGIDEAEVTAVEVQGIENTHGK